MKKLLPASVALALGLTTTFSHAENFSAFHARTMAMGGTGVASAQASDAAFINPAMLAKQDEDRDFELLLPAIGMSAADDDNFMDAMDEFDDYVVDDLSTAINGGTFENGTNTIGYNQRINSTPLLVSGSDEEEQLLSALDAISAEVKPLGGKALRANLGGGFAIAIPSSEWAFALSAKTSVSLVGVFNYRDEQNVEDIKNAIAELSSDIPGISTGIIDPTEQAYAEYVNVSGSGVGTEVELKPLELDSDMDVYAVAVSDFGISVAKELNIAGYDVAIGLTPKIQQVKTYNYNTKVTTIDPNNPDELTSGLEDFSDDFRDADSSDSNLNLDAGAAYTTGSYTVGVSVKNLLAQDYDTIVNAAGLQRTLEIKPQATVGAAYRGDMLTAAFDLDLTEQDGLFEGLETQYAALGLEFNAFDFMALRGGYRHNLSDSSTDVITAGLGFSPFGVMIELGAMVSPDGDEGGFTLQTGYRF